MSPSTRAILKDALALPPAQRAILIEELLASFDTQLRAEVDAAWAAEAEERIDAYDRGEIPAISLETVIDRIKRR